MSEILWPRRLESIAKLVDAETTSLADIGYDHAYLLEHLTKRASIERLIGVEIQPQAHRRVQARLSPALSQRLDLRHGDGLGPLSPNEVDTVVFAGIGELKILQMLDAHIQTAESLRRLIVCPANFKGVLRRGLAERGWRCVAESIAMERGHYYPILALERGDASMVEPLDFFGPHLARHSPDHLAAYLKHLQKRFHAALKAGVGEPTGDAFRDQGRHLFIETIQQIKPALEALGSRTNP